MTYETEEWWLPGDPLLAAEISGMLSPGAVVQPIGAFGARIRPLTDNDREVCRMAEDVGLERVRPDVRN